MTKAKEMFLKYKCNTFYMSKDEGVEELYESYNVPEALEDEWTKEQQIKAKEKLLNAKNNAELADLFSGYGEYTESLGDLKGFQFMLDFVEQNYLKWDTNTFIRTHNALLNATNTFEALENQVIEICLKRVRQMQQREITIDESYKENGKMPDYLTEEKLQDELHEFLDYYGKDANIQPK